MAREVAAVPARLSHPLGPDVVSEGDTDVLASATIQPAEEALASDLKRHWSLDTMVLWLKLIKEASDIPSIPYLKGCVGLALAVAETWQTAKNNRDDCQSLLKRLHELMDAVLDVESRPVLLTSVAQDVLIKLHEALTEIEPIMRKMATQKRSKLKRFSFANGDKAEIATQRAKIDDILATFNTRVNVRVLKFMDTRPPDYRVLNEGDVYLRRVQQSFKDWSIHEAMIVQPKTPALILMQRKTQDSRAEKEFVRVLQQLREAWCPNIPQFFGATRNTTGKNFIALRGPQGNGTVAKRIVQFSNMDPLQASRKLIEMVQGLVDGAIYSLEGTDGQWGLSEYDVYIDEHDQPVVHNFALLLDPEQNGPVLRLQDWRHWDAFINLFTKVLTNDIYQMNHVRGQLDSSRAKVMRLVKLLVVFAWDYTNTVGDRIRNTSSAAVTMMLTAFKDSLQEIGQHLDLMGPTDPHPLLSALVATFGRKLSCIWDFEQPQDPEVHTGDIGYMAGTPATPRFITLGNVAAEISNVQIDERAYQSVQYRPGNDYWKEDMVDGVIRHTCHITDIPTNDTLFRVEKGHRSGRLDESLDGKFMRWDCSRSWSYLIENRDSLMEKFGKNHQIQEQELLLIFAHKQSQGHGFIRLISNNLTVEERRAAFQAEGFDGDTLYFFENPSPRKGEIWGYWSRVAEPGHPIWPPNRDAVGPTWAWDARNDHCRVEVSRVGPQQHIRYLFA